jgi:hypothetical protein
MKAVYRLISLLIVFFIASCSSDGIGPAGSSIEGTWRLYEWGYSPGSGYNVEAVPAKPLQSLTFSDKGELIKQGDRLNGVFGSPYYRVDSTQTGLQLQLLKSQKDTSGFSAALRIDGNLMRISPPCTEGCHYSFVRIH